MEINIIVVGCGGTGSLTMGYLARLYRETYGVNFYLIDGDHVEQKNLERQSFSGCDVGVGKAEALADEVMSVGVDPSRVMFLNKYIVSREDLSGFCGKVTILIGCVDNHRARQVLHEAFYHLKTCIYIDSANEFDSGEVCIGVRINGENIAPPRGYYFPDVLTDRSPRADEMGCDTVNVSKPQHLITNSLMALEVAKVIHTFIDKGKINGGMIFCSSLKDDLTVMTRFAPWTGRAPEEEEVIGSDECF